MSGIQDEEHFWIIDRSQAYIDAICKIDSDQSHETILEVEHKIKRAHGNPPGVITSATPEIGGDATLLKEASLIDPEYNEEHFLHHSKRVKCLFHNGLVFCFIVCEIREIITMTMCWLAKDLHEGNISSPPSNSRGHNIPPFRPLTGPYGTTNLDRSAEQLQNKYADTRRNQPMSKADTSMLRFHGPFIEIKSRAIVHEHAIPGRDEVWVTKCIRFSEERTVFFSIRV